MAQVQRTYEAQLRKVAKAISLLTRSAVHPTGGAASVSTIQSLLEAYAQALQPWATRTAWHMLLSIDDRTRSTWRTLSQEISFGLKRELESAPTGMLMRDILHQQVMRIQSIPLEAASRLEKLTLKALVSGSRGGEIEEALLSTGEVAKSKAIMLARTSVSTAATSLIEARALHIGSPGYLWRTSRDGAVRPSHRLMEGKFVRWNEPPVLDDYQAHAGQFANCRCYPQTVFDHDPTKRS